MHRLFTLWVIPWILVAASFCTDVASADTQSSSSQAVVPKSQNITENLDRYFSLLEELRTYIDRSQFDVDALLERLDYEADDAIEFVRNEIRYEPYPGLLRGARGTLMSLAGNSLDQAVLLATLLSNAGYETRIVHGEIGRAQATQLIVESMTAVPNRSEIGNTKDIGEITNKIMDLFIDPELESDTVNNNTGKGSDQILQLRGRAQRQTDAVLESLKGKGIALGDPHLLDSLISETREYFWLEFRTGPSRPWQSVHPAIRQPFPEEKSPSIKSIFVESVPEDLLHRIRVEAFIKRRTGDQEEIVSVMAPWERPAANLVGTQIVYSNFPAGLLAAPDWTSLEYRATHHKPYEQVYEESVEDTSMLIPMLNEVPAPGARYFDLMGNVIPPMAAESAMAPLFQELGENVNEAASALSNMSGSEGEMAEPGLLRTLEEQWLEISLTAPGRQDKVIKRVLIDSTGNDRPEIAGVGQQVSISIATGTFPEGFFLDAQIDGLLKSKPIWEHLLSNADEQPTAQSLEPLIGGSYHPLLDIAFFLISEKAGEFLPDKRVYHSEPSIIARYRNVWLHDTAYRGFDIVSNTRRALQITPDGLDFAPESAVFFGVWETLSESLANPMGRARGFNTFQAFETARVAADSATLRVLQPADHPNSFNKRLHADLGHGFTIVLPPDAQYGRPPTAWWRVNSQTGETLGMIDIGWGGFAERLALWSKNMATIKAARTARAGVVCGFVASSAAIIAELGTSNIPFDIMFSEYTAQVIEAVGHGVAAGIQAIVVTQSRDKFMAMCVSKLS